MPNTHKARCQELTSQFLFANDTGKKSLCSELRQEARELIVTDPHLKNYITRMALTSLCDKIDMIFDMHESTNVHSTQYDLKIVN